MMQLIMKNTTKTKEDSMSIKLSLNTKWWILGKWRKL